jgi:AraC-like DNA-binding protein
MSTAVQGAWRREPHTVVLHEVNSPQEVPAPFAILSESAYVKPPLEFPPHTHPLHELVWVRGGTMTVDLTDRVVTVPEGHGLWIPAGTVHSGRTTAGTSLYDALFDPVRSPIDFPGPAAIDITSVLASLLTHLERPDLSAEARLRAEAVVFDVLAPSDEQLSLHVPRAERIGPIVATLLEDPTDVRTLPEWAETLELSERTITRLFRTHTGLSFNQWRQALRVHHAIALMAEGLTVQEVSEEMGYAQPSTFIATFKRVVGTTPGAYGRS